MSENQSHNFLLDLDKGEKRHLLGSIRMGCYAFVAAAVVTVSFSTYLLYSKLTEKNEIEFVCINGMEWIKTKYLVMPSLNLIDFDEKKVLIRCSDNSPSVAKR